MGFFEGLGLLFDVLCTLGQIVLSVAELFSDIASDESRRGR